MVESIREIGEKRTSEQRFHISSLTQIHEKSTMPFTHITAAKNQLHWYLDVIFKENACLTWDRNAAENLSITKKNYNEPLTTRYFKKSSAFQKNIFTPHFMSNIMLRYLAYV
ncbi:hypothetical protein [Solimicrobium silvestre]|uniref:Uncharacterized protein n=1 Tax=Solimicrobium silvestre TaxID=2099400 RepID=A0A2S9H1W5_9BURK|nr:hypothetical protein [Solimicrobium silvestre]PRC93969.1 hypothetical protein S2091_1142 [Solimicrobium silvestre]